MSDKPIRHHTHSGWWFTLMPNGDVMVSAGDGIQMVTLNADIWASVVREMTPASGCTPGTKCDPETGFLCHRHWAEKAIPDSAGEGPSKAQGKPAASNDVSPGPADCQHTYQEYGTAEEAGGGAWCLRCGEFIEEPADSNSASPGDTR